MNIIGLMGEAGSGKDTVAHMLVADHGYVRVGLADPIKRLARELWKFDSRQLWGPSKHRNAPDHRYGGLTPREALQRIGADVRGIDESAWIRVALRASRTLLSRDGKATAYSPELGLHYDVVRDAPWPGVVISDCRYRNELEQIREAGGHVVRIRRPGAGLAGPRGAHESETEMATIGNELFDAVVENVGSLSELRYKVLGVVDELTEAT